MFVQKGKAVVRGDKRVWLYRLEQGEILFSDHKKNISKKKITPAQALDELKNLELTIQYHYLNQIIEELAALAEVREQIEKLQTPPQHS